MSDPRALGRPGWRLLASGFETSGGFELFEELRDEPSGPPPHVHLEREELFFILEGRYRFTRGDESLDLAPGQHVLIPRATRHLYRTIDAPSRTLILIAPAGLEGFFREMGERMAAGATSLEAMTRLSEEYDSHPVA